MGMDTEDKMLASAARRRLDSMSTPRPGGWREERSPDGRMTMYVSPKGERLSREEFFDKYPQGTGGSQSIAAGMMKDVASGRSQASLPEGENLKVGVILQPGKANWPGEYRPSGEFHEAQMSRDYATKRASELADQADRLRQSAGKFRKSGQSELANSKLKLASNSAENSMKMKEESSEHRLRQARRLREYNEVEKGGEPTALREFEQEALQYAKDRAKPIPFPDKK